MDNKKYNKKSIEELIKFLIIRVATSIDLWIAIILMGFSAVYIIRWPLNSGSYLPMCLGVAIVILQILKNKDNKTKLQKICYRVLQIGFVYFGITFSIFCYTTIQSTSIDEDKDYDAIIVLGAGLRNGDQLSGTLKYRLDKGIELYESKQVPIVVSGGQGFDELVSEASVMKAYLLENGVNEADVIEEDKSTSTEENFVLSKVKLDEIFTDEYTIVYTTNDFHVFRSGKYMEKSGLTGFGVGTESIASLIPYNYLREYMAVHLYYLFN